VKVGGAVFSGAELPPTGTFSTLSDSYAESLSMATVSGISIAVIVMIHLI
jgi:hypothetical protein